MVAVFLDAVDFDDFNDNFFAALCFAPVGVDLRVVVGAFFADVDFCANGVKS